MQLCLRPCIQFGNCQKKIATLAWKNLPSVFLKKKHVLDRMVLFSKFHSISSKWKTPYIMVALGKQSIWPFICKSLWYTSQESITGYIKFHIYIIHSCSSQLALHENDVVAVYVTLLVRDSRYVQSCLTISFSRK